MSIVELLQEALMSLRQNKMRTILSTLGIIIGTGSGNKNRFAPH